MARLEVNRSGELEVFARVVESGGFSAAARRCGMTPSAVSKLITRLEQRLGTRLLNRSTRQLQLTPEGCTFYERGVRILADLEEAERCASENAAPRGRLRVSANVPFGHHFLLPLVPEFLAQHPEVTLDIVLTDEVVDILEQRTDQASDGEALRRLAVAGLGLARLAAFQVREDIAAGRLIPVLEAYNPGDLEEVHAVYVGQGGYLPLRVRAFLDFLAERVDMSQG